MFKGIVGFGSRIETPRRVPLWIQKRVANVGGPGAVGNAAAARLQLNTLLNDSTAPATRSEIVRLILTDPLVEANWRCLEPTDTKTKLDTVAMKQPGLAGSGGLLAVRIKLGWGSTLPTLADIESPTCRLETLLKVRATGAIADPGVMGTEQVKHKAKEILLGRYTDDTLTTATLGGMLNDADAEVAEGAQKAAADLLEYLDAAMPDLRNKVTEKATRIVELERDLGAAKIEADKVPGLETQLAVAIAKADQVGGLEAEVARLTTALTTARADAGKVGGLEADVARLTVELETARTALEIVPRIEAEIAKLNGELADARSKASAEADRATALRVELEAAQAANAELRTANLGLAERVDQAPKDAPTAIEAHVASLITRFGEVTAAIAQLEAQIGELTGKRNADSKEKAEKDRLHTRAIAKRDTLNRQITERRTAYEARKKEIDNRKFDLENRKAYLENPLLETEFSYTAAETRKLAQYTEALTSLSPPNADIRGRLEQKIATIRESARQREISKITASIALLDEQKRALIDEYDAAVVAHRKEEREFNKLNDTTIPALTERLGTLTAELERLNAEIGGLNAQLDAKRQEKADITRQISDLAAAERGRADRLAAVLPAPAAKSGARKR